MNNVLLGAGKALPATSPVLPMFSNIPSATRETSTPQTPFMPLLAQASQFAGAVQPTASSGLSLTSPQSTTIPTQVSSFVGTPMMFGRAVPVPATSTQTDPVATVPMVKPVSATPSEPQKSSTETQVQQLLQLLVGESEKCVSLKGSCCPSRILTCFCSMEYTLDPSSATKSGCQCY